MNLREVDNFFPIFLQKDLMATILKTDFVWGYTRSINSEDQLLVQKWLKNERVVDDYAFVHILDLESGKDKSLLANIKFYIQKHFNVEVNQILRGRFIFSPPNSKARPDNILMPHIDLMTPHQTLLYYINTNDAETVFFDQSYNEQLLNYILPDTYYAVKPKQGKAVLFDGLIHHAGRISNQDKRILLSVNFI